MFQDRNFFQLGVNNYVPAMGYAAAPIHAAPARFSLGSPATASATFVGTLLPGTLALGGVLNSVAYFTTPKLMDARYGRTVTATPSADPGASGLIVEIVGYDYIGQPMVERITMPNGASALVAGLKAFYYVIGTRVITFSTTAGVSYSVGSGLRLGLPYKGRITSARENATDLTYAQINTAHNAAILTDPQTATTGDPRGTYTRLTAPDGTFTELGMHGDPWVNSSNNGGLLGIKHLAF
jgi:hypothetical protein